MRACEFESKHINRYLNDLFSKAKNRKIRFKVITLFAITLQKIAKNNFAKLGHTQYE